MCSGREGPDGVARTSSIDKTLPNQRSGSKMRLQPTRCGACVGWSTLCVEPRSRYREIPDVPSRVGGVPDRRQTPAGRLAARQGVPNSRRLIRRWSSSAEAIARRAMPDAGVGRRAAARKGRSNWRVGRFYWLARPTLRHRSTSTAGIGGQRPPMPSCWIRTLPSWCRCRPMRPHVAWRRRWRYGQPQPAWRAPGR